MTHVAEEKKHCRFKAGVLVVIVGAVTNPSPAASVVGHVDLCSMICPSVETTVHDFTLPAVCGYPSMLGAIAVIRR